MIYIPPIVELSMVGVLEPGVPNRERVCLRPTDTINLALFGLHAAIKSDKGYVTPVGNIFFWFGDLTVTPPAWLIIFTGKGTPKATPLVENGQSVHVFYWNLETTIFNIPNVVPVAFKISSVLIGANVLSSGERQLSNQSGNG